MPSVEERREERRAFLLTLYELTDGDTMNWLNFRQVVGRLGLDEVAGERLARSVVDQGYAEWKAMGGLLGITGYGVAAAEDELAVGAVPPISVLVLDAEEQAAVEAFLTTYRRSDDQGELGLAGDDRAEADAEVRTLEVQIKSPKPKRRIVRESVRTLREVLTTGVGGATAAAIIELAKHLHV